MTVLCCSSALPPGLLLRGQAPLTSAARLTPIPSLARMPPLLSPATGWTQECVAC